MTEAGAKLQSEMDEVIGELAEEYAQRLRNGEKPDIEEYTRRYPDAADAIRQILPALEIMGEVPEAGVEQNWNGDGHDDKRGLIGEYRIIREVGRGGMGVVYEAEQLSLSRRVALKVLPFAAVLDERQIQRFRNEALAAAQLDHPHIVDVYGVGCERSVHFYAMRYVEGDTLAEVIAELRRLQQTTGASPPVIPGSEPSGDTAGDSTPALAALSTHRSATGREFFRSVARIGVEVAEALDHAHQQGVIHRDIKPANVIIDAAGKSWVTDFGLARMESGATLTMTGDLLGTLRYMSPEQALAKRVVVDHRTDVYSLGVTLYELLTLQPAYGDEDRHELLRKIAFEEPKPPRKLNRAVPEELETIVLKAIAKNPTDRYETAQEFADDLQRYLDDKPIRAKRPGLVQIAGQWMRRHRAVVATSVSILILAVIGLSISVGLISHERNLAHTAAANEKSAADRALRQEAEAVTQRNLARDQAAEAERQRLRAEDNVDLALQALDEVYLRLADERFTAGRELQDADREFLEKAVVFYEQVAEQKRDDPQARRAVAWAHFKIGHIYERLGLHENAGTAFLSAIERFGPLVEASPDDRDLRLQHAESIMRYAGALKFTGQFEESVIEFDRAIPIYRQDDEDHPPRGRTLRDLAWCYAHRGAALSRLDRREEGIESLRRAVACNRRLTEQLPGSGWYRRELAIHLRMLANVLSSESDIESAEELYVESSGEYDLLADLAGDDPVEQEYLAHNLNDRAQRLVDAYNGEELQAAIDVNEERIALWRRLVADAKGNRQHHQELAWALVYGGDKLTRAGRLEEARGRLDEADAILANLRVFWPDDEWTARIGSFATIRRGLVERQAGDLAAAAALFQAAINQFETINNNCYQLSWGLGLLGDVFLDQGDSTQAVEAYERLATLTEEYPVLSDDAIHLGRVRDRRGRLAALLYQQGRADEGERYWRRMLDDLPNAAARYRLRIEEPGLYRLSVIIAGREAGSNCCCVRIQELMDGPGGEIADWYRVYVNPPFSGDFADQHRSAHFEGTTFRNPNEPIVWTFPSAGEYTLELLSTAPGTAVDRFVLQRTGHDHSEIVASPESPRNDNGVFVAVSGHVVIDAVHFDLRRDHREEKTRWVVVPTEEDASSAFTNSVRGEFLQLLPDSGGYGASPVFIDYVSEEDRQAAYLARMQRLVAAGIELDETGLRLARARALCGDNDAAEAAYTDLITSLEDRIAKTPQADRWNALLAEALVDRALLYRKQKEYRAAVVDFQSAAAADPQNYDAWRRQGDVLLDNLGQVEAAIECYNKSIDILPERHSQYTQRGRCFHALQRYNEAIRDFDRSLELRPDEGWTWKSRGTTHFRMGNYEHALADLNKAIELGDTSALTWIPLDDMRDCPDETFLPGMIELADTLVEVDSDPGLLRTRALMLEAAGDLERVAADAERYLELKDYSASDCNDAAWLIVRNSDVPLELTEQALLWARRAVESAPTRDDCWYTCGVAEYRVGHWEQAIEAFHKSCTLIDGRNLGWNAFFLAMAEYQLGHAEQADLWYRAGLLWMSQHAAEDRDAIRFRDEAAQLLTGSEPTEPDPENPAGDIAAFTLAIEAAPNAGWPYSGRARAHLEQEHWSEAAADFARGLAETEPRFRPWYELGLLQAHLGDAEGYQDTCRRMIGAFGEAEDATSRHFAVWTSALLPAALDDYAAAVEIASAMAAESAEDPAEHQNLGVILYRADRAEEALAALTEAERLRDAGGDVSNTSPAYLWYLLSIVHADLGNQDESRDWLAKANERADQELADADNPVAWFRKLTLELLRTEAEGMVAEAESSRSDPSD